MADAYPRAPAALLTLTEPRSAIYRQDSSDNVPSIERLPQDDHQQLCQKSSTSGGFGAQTAPRTSVFAPRITVVAAHDWSNRDTFTDCDADRQSKYAHSFAFTGHSAVHVGRSRAARLDVSGRDKPSIVNGNRSGEQKATLTEVLDPNWEATRPRVPVARIGPPPAQDDEQEAMGAVQRRRKERLDKEKQTKRLASVAEHSRKQQEREQGFTTASKRRRADSDGGIDWVPYQWVTIAQEGQRVTVPPNSRLRFGTSEAESCGTPLHTHDSTCRWSARVLSGPVDADVRVFGDPCPGLRKVLQRLVVSSVDAPPNAWESRLKGVDSIQSGAHTLASNERPPWERWHLTALLDDTDKLAATVNTESAAVVDASASSISSASPADTASDTASEPEDGPSKIETHSEHPTRQRSGRTVRMEAMMGREDTVHLTDQQARLATRTRKRANQLAPKQLKADVVAVLRQFEHFLAALKSIRAIPDDDLQGDEIDKVQTILFDTRGCLRDSTPMLEVAGERLPPAFMQSQGAVSGLQQAEKLDFVAPAKAAAGQVERVASLLLKRLKRIYRIRCWAGRPAVKPKAGAHHRKDPVPGKSDSVIVKNRFQKDTAPTTEAGLLSLGSRRVALDVVLREARRVLDLLRKHTAQAKEHRVRQVQRDRAHRRAVEYEDRRKANKGKRKLGTGLASVAESAEESMEQKLSMDGDGDDIVQRMESRLVSLDQLNSRVKMIEEALPKVQYLLAMHKDASDKEQWEASVGIGALIDDQKHNEMTGDLLRQKLRHLHAQLGETVTALLAIVTLMEKTQSFEEPSADGRVSSSRAFATLQHFAQHQGATFARDDFATAQLKRKEAEEKQAQERRLHDIMERARASAAAVAADGRNTDRILADVNRQKGTSTFGRDKTARIGNWQPSGREDADDGSDAEDYHKLAVHSWHDAAMAVTKPRAPSARIGPPIDSVGDANGKDQARQRIQARRKEQAEEQRPGPGSYDTTAATKHVQSRIKGGLMLGRPQKRQDQSDADELLLRAYDKATQSSVATPAVKGISLMDRGSRKVSQDDTRIAKVRKRAELMSASKALRAKAKLASKELSNRISDETETRPQPAGPAGPSVQVMRKRFQDSRKQELAEQRLEDKLQRLTNQQDTSANRKHIPGGLIMKPHAELKERKPEGDSNLNISYDAVQTRKPGHMFARPTSPSGAQAKAALRRRIAAGDEETRRTAAEDAIRAADEQLARERGHRERSRKDAWSLQAESEQAAQAMRDKMRADEHSRVSEAIAAVPTSIGVDNKSVLAFSTMGSERVPRYTFDFEDDEAQDGSRLALEPSRRGTDPRVTGGHIAPLPSHKARRTADETGRSDDFADLRTGDAATRTSAPAHGFGAAGDERGIEALRRHGLYADDEAAAMGDYDVDKADGLVRPNAARVSLGTEARFKDPQVDDPLSALTSDIASLSMYTSERRVPPRVLFGKHEDYGARGRDPMAAFEDYTEYDTAAGWNDPSSLQTRGAADMSKAPPRFSQARQSSPRTSDLAPAPAGIGAGTSSKGVLSWEQESRANAQRSLHQQNNGKDTEMTGGVSDFADLSNGYDALSGARGRSAASWSRMSGRPGAGADRGDKPAVGQSRRRKGGLKDALRAGATVVGSVSSLVRARDSVSDQNVVRVTVQRRPKTTPGDELELD